MDLQEQDGYTSESAEENYDIEIYSKRAIWGFSIFFSTLFGGVLLMQNLRDAGFKKEGNLVLAFSILYTLAGSVAMTYIGVTSSLFALIFNGCGAAILTEYFFNKYFPEEDYFPKSIVKPLLISMLICLPVILFIYYNLPKGALPAK